MIKYRITTDNGYYETLEQPTTGTYETIEFNPEESQREELAQEKQALLDQIETTQKRILFRWDGMASKKRCYEDSIAIGVTPPCSFDATLYTKAMAWAWQVREQNNNITTANTKEEIQARLDNLDALDASFPNIP